MNDTRGKILRNMLRAVCGLTIFTFGVYLTIQAGIGVGPWDVFILGVSNRLGVTYGKVALILNVLLIAIDLLMKERIGVGTVLDALICSLLIDVFNSLNIIPEQRSLWIGIGMICAGMFIMAFGQYLYMKAGLCCGPKDSLLVALGKRVRRIPIGAVNFALLGVVCLTGWLLGGPVGVGTLILTFCTGLCMQIVFAAFRFEPRDVSHQNAIQSLKVFWDK